jgi:hypothetical protein
MGENLVCCAPLEDEAGTTNNLGLGTPFAGNLEVYPLYRMEFHVGLQEAMNDERGTMNGGATVVRGMLYLGAGSRQQAKDRAELLDVTGRKVTVVRPGANNVSRLAPGVYFVRRASSIERGASGVTKVVIQR